MPERADGEMPLGTTREDQGAWEPVTVPGFVGMRVRRARHVDSDRVRVGDVGPVRVVTSSNSPGEALRTDRDIRVDDPERYALFVLADGISTGEQAAGDMTALHLVALGEVVPAVGLLGGGEHGGAKRLAQLEVSSICQIGHAATFRRPGLASLALAGPVVVRA